MPTLVVSSGLGVDGVASSDDRSNHGQGNAVYGFHLESFSHSFTPVIPLVAMYRSLRGEGRRVQTAARDLCIEVFVGMVGGSVSGCHYWRSGSEWG
jgi:hypothetical protein